MVVPNIITNISIALTPFPLKSTRQSAASMFFLFPALLLIAVEAKVKVWSFSAGHAKLRSGAVFQELVATLGSCDFPNVPRSCEYLGQQRIENSAVPGAYHFVVAGCAAAVDFGSIYGCTPKLEAGDPSPTPDNFCQSFLYAGNLYYGTYKGSASNTGSFFAVTAAVGEIVAAGC